MAKFFLRNPGFELGDQDWTKGSGWSIANNVGQSRSGSWRARFTGSSPSAEVSTGAAGAVSVRPGSKMTVSAYFDGAVATAGDGEVNISYHDKGGTLISTDFGANSLPHGSGYAQSVLIDSVAPDRAKTARVNARIVTDPNGSTWYTDDFDAIGDIIEVLPITAKIQSHRLSLARTLGTFDPLIGDTKFSEFNAGMSDKWTGVFTFIPLHPTGDLGELLGFIERLGRLEQFFAFDPDRLVPKNGVVNGMTVDGAISLGTNKISVKAGPVSSTALVAGDFIEVKDQFFQLDRDLEIGPEGTGEAIVSPSVRSTLANNEDVITDNPKMVARFTSEVPRRSGHDKWTQLSMSWEEV